MGPQTWPIGTLEHGAWRQEDCTQTHLCASLYMGMGTGEFVHEQVLLLAIWGHEGMRTRAFVHNTSVAFVIVCASEASRHSWDLWAYQVSYCISKCTSNIKQPLFPSTTNPCAHVFGLSSALMSFRFNRNQHRPRNGLTEDIILSAARS